MVTRSKGLRSGTRRKMKKALRAKFKPENIIQEFKSGDKVIININPASTKGVPHTRFTGKMGTVKGKKGNAFIINAYIGKKEKEIQVRPEHLKKI